MSGKVLVLLLLIFTVLFAVTLYYFQVFAYYKTVDSVNSIKIKERTVSVEEYVGIDSNTSGLKLRGCFQVDPTDFENFPIFESARPLSAPFWFRCFDSKELQLALDKGSAKAFLAMENEKDGIDRIVAIYPNGDGFQWRQLNSKYVD